MESFDHGNKFDTIKRKDRSPSFKALMAMQISSSWSNGKKKSMKSQISDCFRKGKCHKNLLKSELAQNFSLLNQNLLCDLKGSDISRNKSLLCSDESISGDFHGFVHESKVSEDSFCGFGTDEHPNIEGNLLILKSLKTIPFLSETDSRNLDSDQEINLDVIKSTWNDKCNLSTNNICSDSFLKKKCKKRKKNIKRGKNGRLNKIKKIICHGSPFDIVLPIVKLSLPRLDIKAREKSLQEALNEAVSFFSLTDMDMSNEQSHLKQKVIENELSNKENLSAQIKNCSDIVLNQKKSKKVLDLEDCNSASDIPSADIKIGITEKISCEVQPPKFPQQIISHESALQYAMNDVVTHWLTTDQVQIADPLAESREYQSQDAEIATKIGIEEAKTNTIESDDLKLNTTERTAFHYVTDISRCYREICVEDGKSRNENVNSLLEFAPLEQLSTSYTQKDELSFIGFESNSEPSSLSAIALLNDLSVANCSSLQTKGASIAETNKPYICRLKLRLDPTQCSTDGDMTSLFFRSPLHDKVVGVTEECFSHCYSRYKELLYKADFHQQQQLSKIIR